MLVKLENPKQFGCAPVCSSEPSSTGQKTTKTEQNKQTKKPQPLFKHFYDLGQIKFKYNIFYTLTVRNKKGQK